MAAAARAVLLLVAAALACLPACLAAPAVVTCPLSSRFNGCRKNGCILLESPTGRGQARAVCNECGPGYELENKGTRRAECVCAPGYAARGNKGLCKPCPEGTQFAPGGSLLYSACLNCPTAANGAIFSAEAKDCLCPPGRYKAMAEAGEGFKPVDCRPCEARSAYIADAAHDKRSCDTCPPGKVANKDHTACVDPADPAAAPVAALPALASSITSSRPFEAVSQALANAATSNPLATAVSQVLTNGRLRSEQPAAAGEAGAGAAPGGGAAPASVFGGAELAQMLNKLGRLRLGNTTAGGLVSAVSESIDTQAIARAGLPKVASAVDKAKGAIELIGAAGSD